MEEGAPIMVSSSDNSYLQLTE